MAVFVSFMLFWLAVGAGLRLFYLTSEEYPRQEIKSRADDARRMVLLLALALWALWVLPL